MPNTVLSVPVFSGINLSGAPDVQAASELSACDAYDVGDRGQLVVASDLTTFAKMTAGNGGSGMSPMYGVYASAEPTAPIVIAIGDLAAGDGNKTRYSTIFTDASIDAGGPVDTTALANVRASGRIVTFAEFPYENASSAQIRAVLVCVAARAHEAPGVAPGLYVFAYNPADLSYTFLPIAHYDALGTGPGGEFTGGSDAQQLTPRGIAVYNSHAFMWGSQGGPIPPFSLPVVLDAPNRLSFSNIGNPLKWGNDPQSDAVADGGPESNRQFEDSDAIIVQGEGTVIRYCYPWAGKLWIGTNKVLHYLEGFGRESFQTNGALEIRKSRNVIGPNSMIEGPDGLLYGVSSEGLWVTNGGSVDLIGARLRNFNGFSPGYWDQIWTDPSADPTTYPGVTNQDLVWMFSDRDANQVVVVIPHCNISAAQGAGADTIAIRYSVNTGGFTRQEFPGLLLTAGSQLTRESLAVAANYVADSSDNAHNLKRYRFKATNADAPVLPTALPDVTFGEYAPFGPNGAGMMRRKYVTVAWSDAGLPLAWDLTLTVDGRDVDVVRLTIGPDAPVSPNDGDMWVDTSGTDTNLGNATAGVFTPANASDFLFRRWKASWNKWVKCPGGGQIGTRVTVPISFKPRRGSRFKVRMKAVTVTARYQVENFSDAPSKLTSAA